MLQPFSSDAEALARRCSEKKVFLNISQNSQKKPCASLFFLTQSCRPQRGATLLKKETLAQLLSCEFCETFQNTFFNRTRPMAASI